MFRSLTTIALLAALAAPIVLIETPAKAQQGFPFGMLLTLQAAPMRGSKRIPNIEIGDNGDVTIELWCKAAEGQFSVANDTIIFIPGEVDNRNCPADKAQADDNLLAALADVATWKMQGSNLSLIGSRTLRFQINTN